MSSRPVDLVFDIPGIKLGQLTVLMSICRHAHSRKHNCCTSRDAIAAESHVTTRQVTRIVPTLVKAGYITVVSGKGRAWSVYTVQVDFIKNQIAKARIEARQLSKDARAGDSPSRDLDTPQQDREIVTYSPFDGHFSESRNSNNGVADTGRLVKESEESPPRTVRVTSPYMAAKRDARILMRRLEELSPSRLGDRSGAQQPIVEEQVAAASSYSALIRWPRRNG